MIPIKSSGEIQAMRRSGQAVGEIRDQLSTMIAPGVTTGEIDAKAAELIKNHGGKSAFLNYRGFPGNICISVNEEVVHGIGGKRKLLYGDIVKIDIGIIIDGWIGDTAVTIPVGAVSEEIERLIQVTEESFYTGIAQAKAGERLGNVSAAIQKCVTNAGFSVVREFVGHGVGRKLHEEPQIPNYGKAGTGPKLRAGMTLAIEPMVNMGRSEVKLLADGWTVVTLDKKPSAHYEHTILVTEGEPEVLTATKQVLTKKTL
jgi:methionyl aminopeptidase